MHAERLQNIHVPSLVLIAQTVFLADVTECPIDAGGFANVGNYKLSHQTQIDWSCQQTRYFHRSIIQQPMVEDISRPRPVSISANIWPKGRYKSDMPASLK